MADSPSILVVLPTLGDRLDSFRETLESIDAQRSDVALTLAVVLPERAVEARALASEFGAKLVTDTGRGISDATIQGIAARGAERYSAWMGDDDLFRPGGLKTLLDIAESDAQPVVTYGGCDYIDAEGRTIFTSAAGRLAPWLLSWGPDLVPHPGSLLRLDAVERVGGYDPELRFAMDLDLLLKLRKEGPFASTKKSVSTFRWYPDSLTVSDRAGSSREAMLVKRRHLPAALRPISPLWNYPVAWAAALAANSVSARARRLGR